MPFSPELLIVLLVVLLVFGSTLIPRLARALGHTKRELSGLRKDDDEV